MSRIENIFVYWPGRNNLGPGLQFRENYQPGKAGYISLGHLDLDSKLHFDAKYLGLNRA